MKDNCCPKEKVITKAGQAGKKGKDCVLKNVTTTTPVAGPLTPTSMEDPVILPLPNGKLNPSVKGNYVISFDAQVDSGIQHTLTYSVKKNGVEVNRERETIAMGNISINHTSASFTMTNADSITVNVESSNPDAILQEIHTLIIKQLT